ncbi:SusD-like starch-binding protein associating with outer membrane [Christiangramia gaetbulicola]|uniref:SusD-like starch-binding protein associating with outer membrane n=1 Tax=Christiangramia gaetbulicola TaxID=703340 RepID=A0A2T6AE31_9FLAO|nr:SusD/RagB family nutrient-binding outer membrane lipoprotein [Christiangramia gaetbulicola]PTX42059.1 SusD-like starch-binding protein associating with outer membrane [Christiangramia gaetbulicola]
MKFKIKKYKYVILAVAFSFISCDDYLDINDNPNNPTEAPLAGLMVNSTYESSQNTFRMGDIATNYVQYLASPNAASSSDIMEPVSYSGTWGALYNVMTDINDMILQAQAEEANHYEGVGQILMAYNLGMAVDAWGQVPYSEAFNFVTVTPSYDDDAQLYEEVLGLLDAGIANLSAETNASIGDDDFIYGGNAENWIKFAYMLKARYLNHYSETSSYDPTAVLAAVGNGFDGNEDDAQLEYFAEQFNPWADVAIDNANLFLGGWISEQFIQALDGTTFGVEDPRLPLMVGATDDGEYIGTVNGAGRGDAPEQGARSVLEEGDFYTTRQGPLLLGTYAEQKFIEAEAAFGIDKARSYQAYLDGIRAHMNKIGVESSEIEEYISSPEVSMGVDSFTIDDIFKEKWVAMFLNPEAWVDARRYDYNYEDFDLPENLNPDLNGMFIRRLAYPDSEISRNGSNVPDVTLLDAIFWDE